MEKQPGIKHEFRHVMRIDSLKEYVLITQEKMRVDPFYRQDNGIRAVGQKQSRDPGQWIWRYR